MHPHLSVIPSNSDIEYKIIEELSASYTIGKVQTQVWMVLGFFLFVELFGVFGILFFFLGCVFFV